MPIISEKIAFYLPTGGLACSDKCYKLNVGMSAIANFLENLLDDP